MQITSGSWTHPSVVAFAGSNDPVEVMTQRARQIVMDAIDSGWSGPPFDIFWLADRLGIEVVARNDIRDARTVPSGSLLRIEFNPNKSRGRTRYSIAHEIAHTLFPDCADQIRNRSLHEEMTGDDWQLEALCNIAAAEFLMPVGSLSQLHEPPGIDTLLELRKQFDVSTEALFIRAVQITNDPVAVFSASRIESGPKSGSYSIDYSIGSSSWKTKILRGHSLPEDSVVRDCTAIGYTAKGREFWPALNLTVNVECVGIPPYPHASYPRVQGIVRTDLLQDTQPTINYLKGNALEPRGRGPKLILHVVNDKTPNWGGGFAGSLKKSWPDVQRDFIHWAAEEKDNLSLGKVRFYSPQIELTIGTLVAQKGYGPSPTPRIRYTALEQGLRQAAAFALQNKATIHMPKIGAGQAGGTWTIIEELIETTICGNGVQVTVYDLPGGKIPPPKQAPLDFKG